MKIYILLAGLIFAPFLTSATGYNYLPNDVYIKQQEEKAALEYRISSIEASLQNSPTLSILNIDSRIMQLKQEKQTEINYVTGLYAKNGIIDQLPGAIDKINAKYASQIDNLEQQKDEYNDAIAEDKKLKSEIATLKEQIRNIELNTTQRATQETSGEVKIPSAIDMFNYIDTLPSGEAEEIMGILGVENLKLYEEVMSIVKLKYPYGKPGSARYKWFLDNNLIPTNVPEDKQEPTVTPMEKSIPQTIQAVIPATTVPNLNKKEIVILNATTSEIIIPKEESVALEEKILPPVDNPTTTEKPSFIKRIFNFFINLF